MKIMFDIDEIEKLIDISPEDYDENDKYSYKFLEFKDNTIFCKAQNDRNGKEKTIFKVKGITDIMSYIKQLEEDNEMFREILNKK